MKRSFYLLTLLFVLLNLTSCDDDCTERVLVQAERVDQFGNVTPARYQEVPCDLN